MLEFSCAVLVIWCGVLWYFRRALYARWQEPVFTQPIVIFESDDWGAGPSEQAESLSKVRATLERYVNRLGEHPVMTLGVILAVPIFESVSGFGNVSELKLVSLADDSQRAILAAMRKGVDSQVFSLQLHGFTHFNPRALAVAAASGGHRMFEKMESGLCWTETLPSELQSAWTDGSVLPSAPMSETEIQEVVGREEALWRRLFGTPPFVAVPTTFVWTEMVEKAWAAIGVQWLVTPGARYSRRDAAGRPGYVDKLMLNGSRGAGGLRYVVRDLYFEPGLGHSVDTLVEQVQKRAQVYRPALIEIHRFNFCGPFAHLDALEKLGQALAHLLRVMPDLRFISTARLGEIMTHQDPDWLGVKLRVRIRALLYRLPEIPRFRRIAQVTGLSLPLRLFQWVTA